MINIKDGPFNAVGDGVADDWPAIMAALNTPGAGRIAAPFGVYRTSEKIVIPPAVEFIGEGFGSVIKGDHADDVLQMGTLSRAAHLQITAVTPGSNRCGVSFDGCSYARAENLTVQDVFNGFEVRGLSTGNWIRDPFVQFLVPGCNDGILVDQYPTGDTRVSGAIFGAPAQNAEAGIHVVSTGFLQVSDASVEGGYWRRGIVVDPGAGKVVQAMACSDVWVDASRETGLLLDAQAPSSVISWLRFQQCEFGGTGVISGGGPGVKTQGIGTIDDVIFSACAIVFNAQEGIDHGRGTRFSFVGNHVLSNGAAAPNTYAGLRIRAGVSRWKAADNTAGPSAQFLAQPKYGIRVDAGASNYYIVTDNDLVGNSASGLSDGGTGLSKVVRDNLV